MTNKELKAQMKELRDQVAAKRALEPAQKGSRVKVVSTYPDRTLAGHEFTVLTCIKYPPAVVIDSQPRSRLLFTRNVEKL